MEENTRILAQRVLSLKDKINTEEATKTSMILPFLQTLGYDVFDPLTVVPEYTADIGIKKGEKVDYAILKDGIPLILIEAKAHTEKLDNHHNQLIRYFNVTKAKFAILTNGIEYRFFTDMDQLNIMDTKPFLIVDFTNLKSRDIKELQKFAKDQLDTDKIISMASQKRYIFEVKSIFKKEVSNPSDEFIKFFTSKIFAGKRTTKTTIDDFRIILKNSFSEIINDLAAEQINSIKEGLTASQREIENKESEVVELESDGIKTTSEEVEAFAIVKAILAEIVDTEDVTYKDTKSYFNVLFKNNSWKWICRFHFNTKNKYIGLHINEKEETKFPIEKISEIYKYKKEINEIMQRYIN